MGSGRAVLAFRMCRGEKLAVAFLRVLVGSGVARPTGAKLSGEGERLTDARCASSTGTRDRHDEAKKMNVADRGAGL